MSGTYYFKGKAQWAKVHKPVENYSKDGYQWEISVILDDASQKIFEQSGLSLRPNKKDGSIRFKRPTEKLIKGKLNVYEAPQVIDTDGKAVTSLIGNDSIVVVKVDVYPTSRGLGHQLEAVKVEELIPYGEEKETVAPEDVVPF